MGSGTLFETESRSAVISRCGRYRYILRRRWDDGEPVCFIGLNPSIADAERDDQTIRKMKGFAKRWGFAGITVVNLYAFVATKPADMRAAEDPVGPDNDQWIEQALEETSLHVVCWGDGGAIDLRDGPLPRYWSGLKCLGVTKSGQPRHPSRIAYSTQLVRWPVEASHG